MFVRLGLAMTGIGVACGLAVAIVVMRLMSSLLFVQIRRSCLSLLFSPQIPLANPMFLWYTISQVYLWPLPHPPFRSHSAPKNGPKSLNFCAM